ncbi:Immunoglobulin-like domain, partial [Trinorchestia longiramus]
QWTLHLRYVQPRDAGEYICQLSTDPVMVYLIKLFVTAEATSVIKGGGERYVHEGSSVRLECALQNHTQSPDYVFWYHNGTMINYDLNRKVKVDATADGSALTLLSVGRTDSGNYTCSPANAQFASIMLHIILGDTLAAMKVSVAVQVCSALRVLVLLQLLNFAATALQL